MLSTRTTDETALDLPRSQSGANPQHLIVELLGEYWLDRDEHLPSATLVDLVAEFEVTTASARAALSRLLRRGTIEVRKTGRNTAYRLAPGARRRLAAGRAELVASLRPSAPPWDGRWLVAAFSVPEERRDVRHALRGGLRRLGFGPLYDGLWATAHGDAAAVAGLLDALEVRTATVMHCDVLHPAHGAAHPLSVWDLPARNEAWRDFADRHAPMADAARNGTVGPREALRLRTEVLRTWRTLCEDEPPVPEALLPQAWQRPRAAAVLCDVLDGLAPLAEQRFGQIVEAEAPGLGPSARAHRLTV